MDPTDGVWGQRRGSGWLGRLSASPLVGNARELVSSVTASASHLAREALNDALAEGSDEDDRLSQGRAVVADPMDDAIDGKLAEEAKHVRTELRSIDEQRQAAFVEERRLLGSVERELRALDDPEAEVAPPPSAGSAAHVTVRLGGRHDSDESWDSLGVATPASASARKPRDDDRALTAAASDEYARVSRPSASAPRPPRAWLPQSGGVQPAGSPSEVATGTRARVRPSHLRSDRPLGARVPDPPSECPPNPQDSRWLPAFLPSRLAAAPANLRARRPGAPRLARGTSAPRRSSTRRRARESARSAGRTTRPQPCLRCGLKWMRARPRPRPRRRRA